MSKSNKGDEILNVYIVMVWYKSLFEENIEHDEIYGIYSTAEKAKEAAKTAEEKWDEDCCYNGYSITEYELDIDGGEIRDL